MTAQTYHTVKKRAAKITAKTAHKVRRVPNEALVRVVNTLIVDSITPIRAAL
jgi:hypothetical protein